MASTFWSCILIPASRHGPKDLVINISFWLQLSKIRYVSWIYRFKVKKYGEKNKKEKAVNESVRPHLRSCSKDAHFNRNS
jgi:hypothetical protein